VFLVCRRGIRSALPLHVAIREQRQGCESTLNRARTLLRWTMVTTPIREVFDCASWTPIASPDSESVLLALERRLHRTLPHTFRELFALENGPALLGQFSNSDIPIPPRRLAEPLGRWPGYDPLGDQLLPFMIENQGVCVWAVRLDAGDDPPVVVEVDSGTPPRWRRCADRFSCWLKCQVLDCNLWQSSWFFAQAGPLSPEVLSRLRRCFEEGPQTYGWPGKTNYRFYNARSRLLLCDGDEQCDWSIQPASAELAAAALHEIEEIAGIGDNLYALRDQHEPTLRQWRAIADKG
jgi:hypothetical protein